MASHSTQNAAAFTALAVATSAALTETIAWTGGTAPAGAPNSMIDTTWTVNDADAVAIPFSASYEDLNTAVDAVRAQAIIDRALGIDRFGSDAQAAFAASAVVVAAVDEDVAHTSIWTEMQDLDPDVVGIQS